MGDSVSVADVEASLNRIGERVLTTPVITRSSFSEFLGCDVHFKCENMQRTGSFKYRGATNSVAQLSSDERAHGVVTHSSGNHGAALALAARENGVSARVIVPANANSLKRQAIVSYGAQIIDCGETLHDRETMLEGIVSDSGAVFIPPYNHLSVIAGQGTAALELVHQCSGLDEVWVPVGGGGLASGTLIALSGTGIEVKGAEPELADDAYWSLKRGRLQPQRPPRTMADGLRTALGEITFGILRDHGLDIETVLEAEIKDAQRLLWQRLKLVVEPSAAVALAGLVKRVSAEPDRYRKRRVGIILSGGNAEFPSTAVDQPVP